MTKEEIEDFKKLLQEEIDWSEQNTSGSGLDFDRGFIAGIKQVKDNFADKWVESCTENQSPIDEHWVKAVEIYGGKIDATTINQKVSKGLKMEDKENYKIYGTVLENNTAVTQEIGNAEFVVDNEVTYESGNLEDVCTKTLGVKIPGEFPQKMLERFAEEEKYKGKIYSVDIVEDESAVDVVQPQIFTFELSTTPSKKIPMDIGQKFISRLNNLRSNRGRK